MNWRLGLDLGTNSIGWSVFSLTEEKEIDTLVDLGVRIFSDGRDPKSKEPLAVERRIARGQRKLIYRRKLRRKATFRLLQKSGLFPNDKAKAKDIKSLNPYELRVKALDTRLEPFELGRVLFNLSVRRGFKSNRKDSSREETKDKESKSSKLTQKDLQTNLDKAIRESNCRTLGEFLWKNREQNGGLRFVPDRMIFYPTRQMYEEEFNKIREVQAHFYSNIDWDSIFESIFNQRPLRPQARGYCQYKPTEERTFKSMPCAQKLRIIQDVRNLRYYDEKGNLTSLTEAQDKVLLELLNSKEKMTFDAIRKALKIDSTCTFNLEENRTELKGNTTAVKMANKNRFGSAWYSLPLFEQDTLVETLITADDDDQVLDILKKYNLSDEQNKSILQLILPTGTTMLCRDVSETLVAIMEENYDYSYTMAVEALGYKYADQTVEKYDNLPYYGKILVGATMGASPDASEDFPEKKYGKISNPTVHVALNQTRVVVNELIKVYGRPSQISVELSRDLKASREAKAAIQKKQNENKKRNEILNKNITDAFKIEYPNRNDRLKFRLWEELGENPLERRCIYCGRQISGSELFTKEIEIEHILPFSRTLLDSENNLTIAHSSCNSAKGDRSPYEAFSSNPGKFIWKEILERAKMLKNVSKRNKFLPIAMESFEKDSSFIARQLTDNAYLSKMALRYLKSIVDKPSDVWAVNGGMTKLLRDKWKIDSILKKKIDEKEIEKFGLKKELFGEYRKNRLDHRHHALDAVVIAMTDRSLVKEISSKNATSMQNRIVVPEISNYSEIKDKVKHIVVSFKPDHGAEGKLSKATLLGKIKREERVEITDIKETDFISIKNEHVRNDFSIKFEELKNLKAVIKALKDIYPQVILFREFYVARELISSFTKRKDFDSIVDPKIKEQLLHFIGSAPEKEIKNLIPEFSKQTGIRKVRCFNRMQTPIEIKGEIPRYLSPEDYFAATIWQIPPKKVDSKPTYEAQYIRRDQLDKNNRPKKELLDCWKQEHHPSAKMVCVLHKDDYLEFSDGGDLYKCRVAGFSATNNGIDIRPIYAVNDCADWLLTTQEDMTEKCWKPQKRQNFVAVNVLFGKKMARQITVNPIGRVFRKK